MTGFCGNFMSVAFFMATTMAMPVAAGAFGAVAIGEPANIAKEGVAIGWATKYATKEAAETAALQQCLINKDAPPNTRALCKVIRTFENQCFAVALDKKSGTPGFGWSLKTTQGDAESSAMNNCRDTAGKSRQQFCVVTHSACDGS